MIVITVVLKLVFLIMFVLKLVFLIMFVLKLVFLIMLWRFGKRELGDRVWRRIPPGDQLYTIRTTTWNMVCDIAASELLAGDQLRRPRDNIGVNHRDRGENPNNERCELHDDFEWNLKLEVF